MAAQFINSNKVSMYPTGFRQASIDLQSGQNTEENLTKTKKLSQYANNNNYSFVESDNLIIYLDGYYFKVAVTDIPHANNLYAYIKLVDKTMQVEGNDVTLKTLVNISDSSLTLDASNTFKGLAFDTTVPNDCTGILVKDANGHIITQPLKVSANEIRNVTNGASADDTDQTEDPIHVKFDTDDLKINDGSNSEIPVKALVSPVDVGNKYMLVAPQGASGKPGWEKIIKFIAKNVLLSHQTYSSSYVYAEFETQSLTFSDDLKAIIEISDESKYIDSKVITTTLIPAVDFGSQSHTLANSLHMKYSLKDDMTFMLFKDSNSGNNKLYLMLYLDKTYDQVTVTLTIK